MRGGLNSAPEQEVNPEALEKKLEDLSSRSEGILKDLLAGFMEAKRYLTFAQDLQIQTLIDKAQELVDLFKQKAFELIHSEVSIDSKNDVDNNDISKAA